MEAVKNIIKIVVLSFCFNAMAASHYIDSGASGSNSGTSWENAWTSFSYVNFGLISPGDTVYISGGESNKTYNQTFSITKAITVFPGLEAGHTGIVIIKPSSGSAIDCAVSNATIDGTTNRRIVLDGGDYGWDNGASGASNQTVRYIVCTNQTARPIRLSVVPSGLVEYCVIRNSSSGGITVSGYGHDVGTKIIRFNDIECNAYDGIATDSGAVVYGNTVKHTAQETASHPDGIVVQGKNARVYNNIINGFSQGIYIDNLSGEQGTNIIVYNNVIKTWDGGCPTGEVKGVTIHSEYFNLDSVGVFNNTIIHGGILFAANEGKDFGSISVYNNIIQSGITVPVQYTEDGSIVCNNNLFIDGNSFNWRGISINSLSQWKTLSGLDSLSIQTAPLFVSDENYGLQSTSPARSAGVNLSQYFTTDITGRTRTTWDIGAYEYYQARPRRAVVKWPKNQ